MASKTAGERKSARSATKSSKVLSRAPAGARTAHPAPRVLPVKSVEKAAKMFKGFSASRFTAEAPPPNYVPRDKARDPKAVLALHRKMMSEQVRSLQRIDPVNPGISLALPAARLKALLPTFNAKTGSIDLSDLLTGLKQQMKGTEFYTNGNPTFNRIVQQSRLESQAQDIIASIKRGPGK